jgi:co-chaperonin GroES (HSP10)|tara:strand:+ start:278 stop:679 length:402 start_codon:yes stop_codon:yes gene_type:complete
MALNLNAVKGTPRAFGENVLVSDMHFGEQKTAGGIILGDDDGKTRGIYPRWGRVYSKGSDNKDEFQVGEWILIMHGRWTRGMKVDTPEGEIVVRKVELESILATSTEKPVGLNIGAEYADGEHATIDPSSFIK